MRCRGGAVRPPSRRSAAGWRGQRRPSAACVISPRGGEGGATLASAARPRGSALLPPPPPLSGGRAGEGRCLLRRWRRGRASCSGSRPQCGGRVETRERAVWTGRDYTPAQRGARCVCPEGGLRAVLTSCIIKKSFLDLFVERSPRGHCVHIEVRATSAGFEPTGAGGSSVYAGCRLRSCVRLPRIPTSPPGDTTLASQRPTTTPRRTTSPPRQPTYPARPTTSTPAIPPSAKSACADA